MTEKASSSESRKRSLEPPPAAEVIAGNVDLLAEILSRFPAKSLIRSKCVSKHWGSLISDPQFARNHSLRNPSPSISGLYFNFNGKIESISFSGSSTFPTIPSFPDDGVSGRVRVEIRHSCNGLLLLEKIDYPNNPRFIVCNPTTQKYLVLPPHYGGDYDSGSLAFDPSKSHHYKVVLASYKYNNSLEIYSSEDGCWKRIPTQYRCYDNGVFWRGAIHWLRYHERDLLRFEVEEERMIVTPSPSGPKILSYHEISYFGECGGRLLLVQAHKRSRTGFRILAMDEDYSHWTVNCCVDLKPLVPTFTFPDNMVLSRYGQCLVPVLCVFEGEEEKDFTVLLAFPDTLISYNPKRKTWNVLQQWVPGEKTGYTPYFYRHYLFVPSLSPV